MNKESNMKKPSNWDQLGRLLVKNTNLSCTIESVNTTDRFGRYDEGRGVCVRIYEDSVHEKPIWTGYGLTLRQALEELREPDHET